MDFLLSPIRINREFEINTQGNHFVYYQKNNLISDREIFLETNTLFIIGDANTSFAKRIVKEVTIENIERNIDKLKNGYIIVIDKVSKTIFLYNDIFGFSKLYFLKKEGSIFISTEFIDLFPFSSKEPDEYAILDMLLFNYVLLGRTVISDIKRFKGGSKVVLKNGDFEVFVPNNFADNFKLSLVRNAIDHKTFSNLLTLSISEDLSTCGKNILTITGGFDSRVLLAACKSLEIDLESLTFGQKGSIEQEIVKGFINEFSNNHIYFNLDQRFIDNLPRILRDYLIKNVDNPVLLDLPQYYSIRQLIPPANLILGFMGGEILNGQSIGSQVTFSRAAATLLTTNNFSAADALLILSSGQDTLLNANYLETIWEGYSQTLLEYNRKADKTNILRFIINESFANFFGAINKTFKNHSNLITPFLDKELITYVMNSKISFLSKKPFINNPVSNLHSKILYARSISYLFHPLADTKLDRLYKVKDLYTWYRFPKVIYGYIQSHLLKKNKKDYPKPHHFDLWYKDIIIEKLKSNTLNSKSKLFSKSFLIDHEVYSKLASPEKKRLANLAGILLAVDILKEKY